MWAEVKFAFDVPDHYTREEARQEIFDEVVTVARCNHLVKAIESLVSEKPGGMEASAYHQEWARRLKKYEILLHD